VRSIQDDAPAAAAHYTQAVAEGCVPRGAPVGTGKRSATARVAELGGWDLQGARRRLDVAFRDGLIGQDSGEPPPDRHAQDEINRLRRAVRDAGDAVLTAERIAAVLGIAQAEAPAVPDWLLRVPARDEGPGVPVLHWCDWHIGETVRAEEIKGFNRFDEATADERVRRVLERSLHLAFAHMKTPSYPGAVLSLAGDFVSGWLHDELVATDWCPPTVAVGWVISRLRRCIDELLKAFKRLVVVCVPGNHGRLTRKPWAKMAATACFDHIIYAALAEIYRGDGRVTWIIPSDGEALVQIAGTRALFMHGHELGVKGGDGIIGALGPIMRGAMKVGSQQRSLGHDFDVMVMGHFHQEIWLPRRGVIVGPTLKGYDEYARRERYRAEPAAQMMFFVHRLWGPNNQFAVYAQDPPSRTAVEWVAMPAAA
jgi:hypothetical protein